MVLNDNELDELWRRAGSYGSKIKEGLEVAEENERRSFSEVTTKLFQEYRDLKRLHEQCGQRYEKLKRDYVLRVQALDERIAQLAAANKKNR